MACIGSDSSSCGVGSQPVQDTQHVLVTTGSPWAACYAVMVVFIVNVVADMQKHSQLATSNKSDPNQLPVTLHFQVQWSAGVHHNVAVHVTKLTGL